MKFLINFLNIFNCYNDLFVSVKINNEIIGSKMSCILTKHFEHNDNNKSCARSQ